MDSTNDVSSLTLRDLPRYWFLLRDDVGRIGYAASGFGLAALKYGVEAMVAWQATGRFYTPWDFVNPLLTVRQQVFGTDKGLAIALLVWSLAFVWIAVSMSVRRAAGAGLSPWMGLIVLVPLVNLLFMLALCALPEVRAIAWKRDIEPTDLAPRVRRALLGVVAAQLLGLAMLGLGVYLLSSYGMTLFIGTPIMMGAVAAFLFNRPHPQGLPATLGVALLTMVVAGGVLLLFALEGGICILMAAPLVAPLGVIGGVVGKAIADFTTRGTAQMLPAIAVLFVLGTTESLYQPRTTFVVATSVEIDAPPEVVWNNVVDFPELPPAEEWYFRAGIAAPERARISGRGVGAVRRCEFTTGAFIEPITVWNEPHHLAFDVTEQPDPMFELSPYRHVHPPHLDGGLRSTRGEFRLEQRLPGGRTRLEGRTWYKFDMLPQFYWTLWSDEMIHRIHLRVLTHIKRISERENG